MTRDESVEFERYEGEAAEARAAAEIEVLPERKTAWLSAAEAALRCANLLVERETNRRGRR